MARPDKQMGANAHGSVVDRLRGIAGKAAAGEAIEAATPHPDAELLEICARVLDLHAEAESINREARKMPGPYVGNPIFDAEMKRRRAKSNSARTLMASISKHPSQTAAGIFAKAFVLRANYGGGQRLAMTLAEDLVECPGLRALLWPAERV